jgi:hypothetical protein
MFSLQLKRTLGANVTEPAGLAQDPRSGVVHPNRGPEEP